jgi:hypothetical protein
MPLGERRQTRSICRRSARPQERQVAQGMSLRAGQRPMRRPSAKGVVRKQPEFVAVDRECTREWVDFDAAR